MPYGRITAGGPRWLHMHRLCRARLDGRTPFPAPRRNDGRRSNSGAVFASGPSTTICCAPAFPCVPQDGHFGSPAIRLLRLGSAIAPTTNWLVLGQRARDRFEAVKDTPMSGMVRAKPHRIVRPIVRPAQRAKQIYQQNQSCAGNIGRSEWIRTSDPPRPERDA
jgi:hypothetical protein